MVQESINAFAYDITENKKSFDSGPLNAFIGILKRGNTYSAPANYESPKDRALRIYLTEQRERKERRDSLEREAFLLAFDEWKSGFGQEEQESLMGPVFKKQYDRMDEKLKQSTLDETLSKHFEENIWPGKRNEIFGNFR
jgi:hypothetical protein